jgi:glycosyltransferase involved in cell wall biosynthesis
LLVGTGNYDAQLRKLAEGSSNIQFLGYVSDQHLQALYRKAVAVIAPSINFEAAPPLVIKEAFRQQTPAIVRNIGSMPEIIEDSGAGFVYDTEEELVAAMNQLLENPSYRRELGRRGYQAYQQKWTADAHLQPYFALIHEIAATRGKRNHSHAERTPVTTPADGRTAPTCVPSAHTEEDTPVQSAG